uniref:Centromere protein Cenp-F N-terminal domain-containing protein n=1 Tax=Echeneis naucrates TaxID=173247 RepID=A0A665XDT8_ECHNA
MSWAEEDWTVGLSGRVLQKVKELQVHHERLSRENKQKQVQLDNIQNSLEKQTLKVQTAKDKQPLALTFRPTNNLKSPFNLNMHVFG